MKEIILNKLNRQMLENELQNLVELFYFRNNLLFDVDEFITTLEELKNDKLIEIEYFDRNLISKYENTTKHDSLF